MCLGCCEYGRRRSKASGVDILWQTQIRERLCNRDFTREVRAGEEKRTEKSLLALFGSARNGRTIQPQPSSQTRIETSLVRPHYCLPPPLPTHTTQHTFRRLGESCQTFRLSGPLKAQYAKEHNLDLTELLSASSYKEKYRVDMIRWLVKALAVWCSLEHKCCCAA